MSINTSKSKGLKQIFYALYFSISNLSSVNIAMKRRRKKRIQNIGKSNNSEEKKERTKEKTPPSTTIYNSVT